MNKDEFIWYSVACGDTNSYVEWALMFSSFMDFSVCYICSTYLYLTPVNEMRGDN